MSEFAGESSGNHDKTTTKWTIKMHKMLTDIKANEGVVDEETGQMSMPLQGFVNILTAPISNDIVDMETFDFPESIGEIDKDDTARLKNFYRVFGASCFSFNKSQSSAMSYMTSIKNLSVV
jgi:hypothetical protein